jgi:hypothetical protein
MLRKLRGWPTAVSPILCLWWGWGEAEPAPPYPNSGGAAYGAPMNRSSDVAVHKSLANTVPLHKWSVATNKLGPYVRLHL